MTKEPLTGSTPVRHRSIFPTAWALLLLLVSLSWLSMGSLAWAESQWKVAGEPILTLRVPSGGTKMRLAQLEATFQGIVDRVIEPPLQVSVEGDEKQAQISLNGQLLLTVTPEDAAANATTQAVALAELWGNRLQSVLNQQQVQRQLFSTGGLPSQFQWGNRYYQQQQVSPDVGKFVTDGTRVLNRVLFWEGQGEGEPMPAPAPKTLYLLNRYRQFVAYTAP
ncbi:MAG: hypothetical protein NW237_11645 [Cyanobacteriota bacterium]|nr:hypothetical protein [Cyanobacteriota bacterium]